MHNGSIAGMVYEDRNASGTFDAGDVGIGSVSIRITGTTIGGVIVDFSVNTQPDGSYLIPGLAPGTYRIAETQPTGYLDKDETIGGFGAFPIGALDGNDAIKDIVIIPGANLTGYNFGEVLPSAIRGFVYVDRDNDGVKDPGESAIRLVTVRLIGTDDRGQVVSIPLLTDMSGRYAFDNLRPGTYTVIEVQPRVALDGRDTLGSPSFGATAFNDRFTSFVLTPGSISEGNNFGELPLNTQLGGWIYVDRNANGRKDVGEVGIGGIVVSLTGTNDLGQAVRRTVVTDVYGRYRFLQLRPGTYTLSEVHPAQFLDGIDTLGNAGGVRVNDSFRQISLGAGVVGDNYNFGERGLAPIAISKRMFMTPNMGLPISGTGFTRTNNAGTGGGVIVP
jgi:hypothetical protein